MNIESWDPVATQQILQRHFTTQGCRPELTTQTDSAQALWTLTNLLTQAEVAIGRTPSPDKLNYTPDEVAQLFIDYAKHVLIRKSVPNWQQNLEDVTAQIQRGELHPFPELRGRDLALQAMNYYVYAFFVDLRDPILKYLLVAIHGYQSVYHQLSSRLNQPACTFNHTSVHGA
jgi:hypothetical protein